MMFKLFRKAIILSAFVQIALSLPLFTAAQDGTNNIAFTKDEGSFILTENGQIAPVVIDANDYPGVIEVGGWFINDLKMVTGQTAAISKKELPQAKQLVLVGTIGKSQWIDQLIKEGKIDVSGLRGQWERSLTQVVENPFPGVEKALVLAGSDKRGTIYAMLNLSREMGVSPLVLVGRRAG